MKKLNKKGFTIVELVIVIAVIAILAGVLIPTFATVVDKANESAAMQQAKIGYENYLANYADKTPEKDFYIAVAKNGSTTEFYYFHVENGQFKAKATNLPTGGSYKVVKFDTTNKEAFATSADGSVAFSSPS